MYLKYVEMQGFKSFPDKTTFRFDKGVTAIVGPNGSGKSNVSDAIRWVLGEISSKSLRGSKMEDVIFSGAQGRSASSFAEVSLCMDNSDGWLNDEHDEVIVTRHYSRSGNSEYYINKKEVRLRDIHELFMDTGIGRDGYSIIGQGQVAEILSTRSDTRREMIDEAAGISKFKHKKGDAVKNLNNTADNLVRLTDILGEVSSRVEPLRREAEKTEKYLVLYNEAKTLEVSLWMDEIDSLASEKAKVQSAYDSAKEKLDICEREIAECEEIQAKNEEIIRENNLLIDENREGIKNHEQNMKALSEKKSVLENDLQHYSERLREINEKYFEQKAKMEQKTKLFDEEHGKAGSLDKKKTSLEAETAKGEERLEELSSTLFNMDFEIGNMALTKELISQELSQLKLDESTAKASAAQLSERIEQTKNDGGAIDADTAQRAQKAEALRQSAKEKERLLSENQRALSENAEKIKALDEKARVSTELLHCATVKRAETAKHIDMLTRMENMLEGYAYSVKAVMQAASNRRINGIHGPVSKLISTEEKYALALEVALGAQAQHIVTEDEKSAKAGINELRVQKAGRATFLPLDTISGKRLSKADVNVKDGFVAIACELVDYDKKYESVVNYLLGRTVIAKDIDSAAAIARACAYRYKVVSLDGQVVNAGGSFTGGSVGSKTGMLTRSADIDKLTAELAELDGELSRLSEETETAARNKKELTETAEKLSLERLSLESARAAVEAELSALGESMEGDKQRLMSKNADVQRLEAELSAELRRIEKLSSDIVRAGEELKNKENEYEAKRELYREKQSERDELQNKLYDMKIELAEVAKDIENYLYNVASMAQTLEIDSAEIKNTEKVLTEVENKIALTREQILITKTELDGGSQRYANMELTVKKLDRENLECTKAISDAGAKLKKCYGEKENLLREYTRAEARLENGATEHDRLIARLFDTYDLTYTTATEFRTVIENKTEASKRLSVLKGDIKRLGSVNLNAVSEYAEVKERYEFLSVQVGDLVKSKDELEKIIADLDVEMKRILTEAMKSLDENFSRIFKELFGGGKARICFADEDDIIDGDIDIIAQPPGKTVNNIQLLSGGERSLISISLYFALIAVSPTPFCIMDEIESALDDVNVDRFAQYARRFCEQTQFIMITHRRGTMNVADILYGITMQEKGISKYLTISVDEVEKRLGIKL